jgi:hypothetical protein
MKSNSASFLRHSLAGCALVALLLSGCATSAPTAKFEKPPAAHVAGNDQTKVVVTSAGAEIKDYEIARLQEEIVEKLKAKQATAPQGATPKTYEVDVTLTRYEKGNAFARAMLAGLGQIHIDAVVTLYAEPGHTPQGKFTLNKTFAWGGIYGAGTGIEDVEKGFADGVAAALTGQPEEQKK